MVQTEDRFMRGFDYRSKDAFALFLAKEVPNNRLLQQCSGRIGRYDDDDAVRFSDVLLKNLVSPNQASDERLLVEELAEAGLFLNRWIAAEDGNFSPSRVAIETSL